MMKAAAPNVGASIRAIRENKGLSLRALAERCGLSVNAISLIERGENSPTVSSLHLLAGALAVPITEFFQDESRLSAVHTRHDRRLLYRRSGVAMESLGLGLRDQQLQPFLITVEPGCGNTDPVSHPGQEFVHCLDGEIQYRLDAETYSLGAGDSLLLDAGRPHSFRNVGAAQATILVVFQSAENPELGRERHMRISPGA
jgi:transcriptional regulator with XRE-family HTH domain